MALKNVERVTFSLPKVIVRKLEISIPKNKRSKYVAQVLEQNLKEKEFISLEDVEEFWNSLANKTKRKTKKTAVELMREDRLSH